ncbi:DMT family transporter [Clostridium sp. UBA6640]|uniref:DMT family transporter n=1 Tax=Clostridium sp. UBA6640 TaxID=1946370 RepID=UPI0025BB8900|nr:DMT family transporter [Clostridium sp. UBA6640]
MRFIYYFLALISGFALTLQAGINAELRSKIGSPILSSLISFAAGTIALIIIFSFTVLSGSSSQQNFINIKNTSWWMFTGGLLGAFYIFTNIFTSPKIGFANMFSLVICGQIILAVIFDHFGLLGNPIHTINPLRILGIIVLVLGVYIIQTH